MVVALPSSIRAGVAPILADCSQSFRHPLPKHRARSNAWLDGNTATLGRLLQRTVIVFVLISVRLTEYRHCVVERIAGTEICGDRDRSHRPSARELEQASSRRSDRRHLGPRAQQLDLGVVGCDHCCPPSCELDRVCHRLEQRSMVAGSVHPGDTRSLPPQCGRDAAVELGGHESRCRVDVVEESLVAGTEIVHPG